MKKTRMGRCSRAQLLEMLQEITEENERLRWENTNLKKELDEQRIQIASSGTLAEAALKLSGIFEAADTAVRIYQESLQYEHQIQ